MADQHSRFNSRRAFLKGIGACIAIPTMESLIPRNAAGMSTVNEVLATTATGAPLRTAFLSFPNGAIPESWWPKTAGASFELSPTLKPLENLKDSIQVLRGLTNHSADPGRDGGGDHARGNSTLLTGVRIKKSSTHIKAGISIDQLIANRIGHLSRFPSLELASDPTRYHSGCDSGYSCAYQFNISWKSESTPTATENNPRLVFERLFGAGNPQDRLKNLKSRRAQQNSILDFVLEDAKSLQRKLQSTDQQKLEEYLTGVRELESRIQRAEKFPDPELPSVATPTGIPHSHQEYVQLMYELSALAFETDSTRVLSLMLGHDGDNRSYDFIGIPEGHHDLSHHQNKSDRIEKIKKIDHWYVEQFAKFLERLNSKKDVDGNTLLHNSTIMFASGNADGNRHTHTDLPVILAGGGGGNLTTGRYVNHDDKPLSNLFLAMAENVGLKDVEQFGDSTGRIANV
jgi:hypothetical protein